MDADARTKSKKWENKSETVRRKEGMLCNVDEFIEKKALRGLSRTDRVLDLVDITCGVASRPQHAHSRFYVDVSQDVLRRPWTCDWLRSLTTSTQLYGVVEDRAVLAREHMRFLGFPQQVDLTGQTQITIKDLAGEGMAPPCIGLVMVSALAALHLA